jgi:hypothetical protein
MINDKTRSTINNMHIDCTSQYRYTFLNYNTPGEVGKGHKKEGRITIPKAP